MHVNYSQMRLSERERDARYGGGKTPHIRSFPNISRSVSTDRPQTFFDLPFHQENFAGKDTHGGIFYPLPF